ncbi:centrosomal protein of 152 kDa-like isoform X2 [Ptychodera flava]|uniref:centrosomal protein of 152 kDa-like isoform X2 n=1 Tax=Ptychodera flava TaxID=63121 RepID=UPI00396AA410
MMNPGTSMDFDGQALEQQDEEELEREDQEREKELRELLSKALPDDLLEDDTISLSSHDSSLMSEKDPTSPKTASSAGQWQQNQQQQQNSKKKGWHEQMVSHKGSLQQQTSTPIDGNSPPPPLETPGGVAQQNGYADKHYEHNGYQNGDVHRHNGYTNGFDRDYEYTHGNDANYENHDYNQHAPNGYTETNGWHGHNGYHNGNLDYDRQVDGNLGDEERKHANYNMGNNSGDAYNGYYPQHNGYVQQYENGMEYHEMSDGHYDGYVEQQNGNDYINYNGSTEQQQNGNEYIDYSGSTDDRANGSHEHNGYHYDGYNGQEHHSQPENMTNGYHNPGEGFHPNIGPKQTSSMPELNKAHEDFESYKVQYRAHVMNGHPENGTGRPGEQFVPPKKVLVQDQKMEDFERLQKDFLSTGGLGDAQQLAQIQILYKARGRRLEELTSEVEILKEEKGREIRILNHKLAVSEGERQGMASGLQQVKQLLQNSKQETALVQTKLNAAEAQIHSLTSAKTEILGKLQLAEATIESLNHQLMELGKSESLSRARDQHDAVVASMQRKYEYDLCEVREKLDQVKAELEQQVEDNGLLKKQLSEVARASEKSQIDHTETINKLTKNLEDSQKQCRELLETGSVQEISQLKIQLQQANTARNISEGMYQALQDELSDLKEQLQLYESAAQLGVYSNNTDEGLSDSFAHLNIKQKDNKSDWKTPKLHRMNNSEDMSSDDLINGLKTELERSLSTIRSKRGQVTRLQNEIKTARAETEELKNKSEKSEKLAKDCEVKLRALEKEVELLKPAPGVLSEKEREFKKESDRLTQVYEQLKREHQELQQRFKELRDSEEKLNELNTELKKEMAQMVSEYDEDKRVALERCQNACLQLHEDSTHKMREELQAQLENEKMSMQETHQQQVTHLQSELENAMKEVDDVKQLYINICEEKTKVELKLRDELAAEQQEKLAQAKDKLQKEKEDALEQLRQSLQESHKAEMKIAEEKWQDDNKDELQRQLDAKVALAKVEWLEEHNQLRQTAADNAVSVAEREWKAKLETQIEEGVQKKLQLMKENGKNGFDKEHLMRALDAEKEKMKTSFDEEKKKAVETAVALAEVEWMAKHQASGKQQLECALKAAKESWKAESEKDLVSRIEEERKRWKAEQDKLARDCEVNVNEDEVRARIDSAVSAAKDHWRKTHEQVLRLKAEEAVRKAKNEWRMQGVEDMSTKIKDALKEARERWHAQSKAEVMAKIDDAVRRAKLEWELNSSTDDSGIDLKAAIDKARQDWDGVKQTDVEKQIETAVQQCRETLNREHHDELTRAISEAKASVWKEVKSTSDNSLKTAMADLQQEIHQLRNNQEHLVNKRVTELKTRLEEEKANLIEEKNREKKDALKRMQEKCDAEYSVFLEEHKETLKKTIKRCKEEFEKEKMELLQQKDADIKAFLTEKEKRWKGDYSSFLEKHRSILDETLDSARKEWEKETQGLKKKHKADLQALQGEYDDRKKTLEKKFAEKISVMKEELNKGYEAKVKKTCDEMMKKKESQWQEERLELLKQLQETEQELREVEKQLKGDLDNLRYKLDTEQSLSLSVEAYEKERSELKGRLEKANRELRCSDENLRLELSQLRERLEKEHKAAVRRLESKLAEQERKHTQTVEALTQQLLKAKQLVDSMEEKERDRRTSTISTQTDQKDMLGIHGDGLQELREHYIAAVNKIRSDVILYINESRDRCAETVRSEVVKERHCTAKKLRKYYLQCLHQLLEEEKNGDADRDFDNVSASQKLAIMAKALEVTPECIVEKKKPNNRSRTSTGRSGSTGRNSRSSSTNNSGKSQHSTGSSKRSGSAGSKPIARRRNLSDEFDKFDNKNSSERFLPPSSEDRNSSNIRNSSNKGGSALQSVNSFETPLSSYTRNSDTYSGKYISSSDKIKDYELSNRSQSTDYHSNKENIQYSPLTKPKICVTDKPVNRPYDMSKENSVSSLLEKYRVDPVTGNISISEAPQKLNNGYSGSHYDSVMSLPQEPREFNPLPEKLTPDSKEPSPKDRSYNTSPATITLRPRSSSRTPADLPVRSRSRPSSPVDVYRPGRSRERIATPARSSSSDAYLNFNRGSCCRDTPASSVTSRYNRENSPMRVLEAHYYSSSEMATPVQTSKNGHNEPTKLTSGSSEERSSTYLIRPIRDQNGPPDGQSNNSRQAHRSSSRENHSSFSETPKMPKPVPMVTRETQAPSPAPTNLSFVSVDTYNDLPANLESAAYKVLQDRPSNGRSYEHHSSDRAPLRHHPSSNYSTPSSRITSNGQTSRNTIQTLPSRPQISTQAKQTDGKMNDSGKTNNEKYSSFHPVRPSKTH